MDASFLSPIIAAIPVLLGVVFTGRLQQRMQQTSQRFQRLLDEEKRKQEERKWTQERTDQEVSLALERLIKVHCLLSVIGREFSRTNFNIIWRAGMLDTEYDQKHLLVCREVDELRAIIGLFEPDLSREAEKIYGLMDIFWGSFKDVLRLTAQGETVTWKNPVFETAHSAAMEVENRTTALKIRLAELADQYRKQKDKYLRD